MKKLVLAIAVSAACANFANAGDLEFDMNTELGKSIECGIESEITDCNSVTYEYGFSAFTAFNAEVDAINSLEQASAELAGAEKLAADLKAATGHKDSDPAYVAALAEVKSAETEVSTQNQVLADASELLAGYTGEHAENAIAYAQSELAADVAQANLLAATEVAFLASADAALAQTEIDAAADEKNLALENYNVASAALKADPDNADLIDNKITAARDFTEAGALLTEAQEDGADVIEASEAADLVLAEANTAVVDSQATSDNAWDTLSGDHANWEVSVETAVISAQHAVDDATEVLTSAEELLTSSEAAVADAQSAVESAISDSESAVQAVADAEAATISAQAAIGDLPADVGEDELNAALALVDSSETAEAEAVLQAAEAVVAIADANAALDLTERDALLSNASVELAQLDVDALTQTLDATLSELEVHAAYIGDDSNPANVLLNALVSEEDHAQAVITAVSDTYGHTVVNANDIATNATAIGVNTTAIGVNTTAIGVNTTAIGVNTAAIDTNAANIGSNRADINSNSASISQLSSDVDILRSGVAASLAAAGMPIAPGEGWGAAVGTGYFDGESAIAAGITYRAQKYNFKLAIGSSGSETTGSAGVAWDF